MSHMIFRNTSWSNIDLFREGFSYSFCFADMLDYGFSWSLSHQASPGTCEAFTGSYRSSCWSRGV